MKLSVQPVPGRDRTFEICLDSSAALLGAAVAGNFTAWVPVPMLHVGKGRFRLRASSADVDLCFRLIVTGGVANEGESLMMLVDLSGDGDRSLTPVLLGREGPRKSIGEGESVELTARIRTLTGPIGEPRRDCEVLEVPPPWYVGSFPSSRAGC